MNTVFHTISPVFDKNSEILILGSFPSVLSRSAGFFYGNPRNRFWNVLSAVYGEPEPRTETEKRSFLLSNKIALWDVIASCELRGSADNEIKNAVPNDIRPILESCRIRTVFVNGRTAEKLYKQYILPLTGRGAVFLPSTSPANASWTTERLFAAWSAVKNGCKA